jgi:hypothetical protein
MRHQGRGDRRVDEPAPHRHLPPGGRHQVRGRYAAPAGRGHGRGRRRGARRRGGSPPRRAAPARRAAAGAVRRRATVHRRCLPPTAAGAARQPGPVGAPRHSPRRLRQAPRRGHGCPGRAAVDARHHPGAPGDRVSRGRRERLRRGFHRHGVVHRLLPAHSAGWTRPAGRGRRSGATVYISGESERAGQRQTAGRLRLRRFAAIRPVGCRQARDPGVPAGDTMCHPQPTGSPC